MNNTNPIQAKFDHAASNYDIHYKQASTIFGFEKQRRLELLLQAIKVLQTQRVLDAGCGPGIALVNLDPEIVKFHTGVDISFSMLKTATTRVRGQSPVLQAIVENLPFQAASFDLVFALGVMDYLEIPERFFTSVQNVLKSGGYFIFTYPNRDSFPRRLRDRLRSFRNKTADHVVAKPILNHHIEQIILKTGYTLLERRYITYGLGFLTFPWSIRLSLLLEGYFFK